MFSHSNTASFFCVLIAALISSLSLAGVASAQTGNTSPGTGALVNNTKGIDNTAIGLNALENNTTGNNNTASGAGSLVINTTGIDNTAIGLSALHNNSMGNLNTAIGFEALTINTTGNENTAIGAFANVDAGNLFNATAIGNDAIVNASNKIRLGNVRVRVIEGQVAFTASSDKTKKENFMEKRCWERFAALS